MKEVLVMIIFTVRTDCFPESTNKVTFLCAEHVFDYTVKLQNDCVIKWEVKGTILTLPVSVVLKIFKKFGFTRLQGREYVSHYMIIIPDDYIDRVFKYIIMLPEFQKANGINECKLNPMPPYLYESDKFALGAMVGPFVGPIFGSIFSSENDADNTKNFDVEEMCSMLKIKKVVFNDPATIVYWEDNSKTVVKCQDGEVFDKEKGLAMCFVKKILGNKGNYYETIKKFIE